MASFGSSSTATLNRLQRQAEQKEARKASDMARIREALRRNAEREGKTLFRMGENIKQGRQDVAAQTQSVLERLGRRSMSATEALQDEFAKKYGRIGTIRKAARGIFGNAITGGLYGGAEGAAMAAGDSVIDVVKDAARSQLRGGGLLAAGVAGGAAFATIAAARSIYGNVAKGEGVKEYFDARNSIRDAIREASKTLGMRNPNDSQIAEIMNSNRARAIKDAGLYEQMVEYGGGEIGRKVLSMFGLAKSSEALASEAAERNKEQLARALTQLEAFKESVAAGNFEAARADQIAMIAALEQTGIKQVWRDPADVYAEMEQTRVARRNFAASFDRRPKKRTGD